MSTGCNEYEYNVDIKLLTFEKCLFNDDLFLLKNFITSDKSWVYNYDIEEIKEKLKMQKKKNVGIIVLYLSKGTR